MYKLTKLHTVVRVYNVTTVYWRSFVVVVPDKGNSLCVHSLKSVETPPKQI